MPFLWRRTLTTLLPLLLLAFLAPRVDAQDLSDCHLRKMAAAFAEPSRKGLPRSKLKVVGGVGVLVSSGAGEWKQTGMWSWTYREQADRRVKLSIEFGTRVDGQEAGSKWKWIPAGGGIPSKAPGWIPPAPETPDDPPAGGGDPVPVTSRVPSHGTGTRHTTCWQDRYVVRDAVTFQAEWTKMAGASPPPSVDFATELVLLLYGRGNFYQVFDVLRDATGIIVRFRPVASPGVRTWVYRAIAVPRQPGTVTFQQI